MELNLLVAADPRGLSWASGSNTCLRAQCRSKRPGAAVSLCWICASLFPDFLQVGFSRRLSRCRFDRLFPRVRFLFLSGIRRVSLLLCLPASRAALRPSLTRIVPLKCHSIARCSPANNPEEFSVPAFTFKILTQSAANTNSKVSH